MKRRLIALILALCAVFALWQADWLPWGAQARAGSAQTEGVMVARKKKNTPTPRPSKTPKPTRTAAVTATPAPDAAPTVSPVPEGPIIDPQSIADYIFAHGELPDNFITKKEAQALGWDSRYNDVSDVAPGYSIGGDYFGNYEGLLPREKGRIYYECDCWYESGRRNAYRIIFSNDGLVFYTEDHYETFVEMRPWIETISDP